MTNTRESRKHVLGYVGFFGIINSGLHLGQIPGAPTSAKFCVSFVSQLEQNFIYNDF